MSITRIPAADLSKEARDFTPEEQTALGRLTEEQIETAALADPDAQPWSDDMFRRARAFRRLRLDGQNLGATLHEAEPTLDLPVWEVIDARGDVVRIKAADVRRVTTGHAAGGKILEIEAVTPDRGGSTERDARTFKAESQKA